MGAGQAAVESRGLQVVVGQGAQRPGDQVFPPLLRRVGGVPLAVVAALGEQPAGPGGQIGHGAHHHDRHEREQPVLDHPSGQPVPDPGHTARVHVPQHGHQPEHGHERQPGELHAAGGSQQDPGQQAPGSPSQPGAPGQHSRRRHPAFALGRGGQACGQVGSAVVPVHQQRTERGEDEEGEEDVQQTGAGEHQVVALHGQQDPGHTAQEHRAEHPLGDQGGEQDGQGAGQRRREAPAEAVVGPEGGHAQRDQPLAQGRVDHVLGGVLRGGGSGGEGLIGVVRPVQLVSGLQESEGVLDVVGLVEDQGVGVVQSGEPQHPRDHGDHQGDDPAPVAGVEALAEQPEPQRGLGVRLGRGQHSGGLGRAHHVMVRAMPA